MPKEDVFEREYFEPLEKRWEERESIKDNKEYKMTPLLSKRLED